MYGFGVYGFGVIVALGFGVCWFGALCSGCRVHDVGLGS